MAGYKAFKDDYLGTGEDSLYTDFEARAMRYAILWAMYENSTYRNLHKWSTKYKADYGLYKFIRAIYNPSYRLGEFWKIHLIGGPLGIMDGKANETGALPIVTSNETLREPIATVWRWSNWQIKKGVLALWTSVMGDGVIKIEDDPEREKVYLKLIHPGILRDVTLDDFGNVKGYILEERRTDPRPGRELSKVMYREVVTRNGDDVVYRTFLDERPFAWNETQGAEWNEPYTFVPMVVLQHNDVGLKFGMSEIYPGLSKFREVDDLASKLSDQVRKLVDSPWLMAGVKKTDLKVETPEGTDANPQKGRESVPMIFAPADAKAQPIVAPLDIAATAAYIMDILKDIERDYPEMTTDMHNVEGEISGRALRIHRGPAEDKVLERRPNYDNAIVRAQQMAVAIGGFRKYPGFEGFDLGSYAAGKLDHQIGERPVFSEDPLDDSEEETAFWTAAKTARDAGVPLTIYLKRKGWEDKDIKEIENSPEFKAKMAALEATVEAAKMGPGTQPGRNNNQVK